MDLLKLIDTLNYHLAIPTAFILLGVALYLTFILKFIQFRSFKRFFSLILKGWSVQKKEPGLKTINPFHALFTAMSTSLGIGTIVGPSVAITIGGPGALFWIVFYGLFGSVTKFAEVSFALYFRKKTEDGSILGGPMQYLNAAHHGLGRWYAYATIFLFSSWSGVQSNVLSEVLYRHAVPQWVTGVLLATLTFIMLRGGAKRIGNFNSKLVPIMTILYVSSGFFILFFNRAILAEAFSSIFLNIFTPTSAMGGFLGASVFAALQTGIYKGAFITECGIGTAAIPHSMADTENPSDQGVLAMISVFADTSLCLLSGLLVLTSNFWKTNTVSNIIMSKIFDHNAPGIGEDLLALIIILFATGTIIGNSFNGRQSFASITQYRWLNIYYLFVCLVIFFGATAQVPLVWAITDLLLPLVAIPNVLGLIYLSAKYRNVLQ